MIRPLARYFKTDPPETLPFCFGIPDVLDEYPGILDLLTSQRGQSKLHTAPVPSRTRALYPLIC
jgi:hypothetical protein